MNNKSLNALLKTSILLGALFSTQAFAQSTNMAGCDPIYMQKAEQIQQQEVLEAAKHAEDIWTGHTEQPPWMQMSDGILTACANNNWPYANVANPILNLLLDGGQQRAVKEACNRARNAIAEGAGKYYETLGTIDNYKDIIGNMRSGDVDWGDYWDMANEKWGIIDRLPDFDIPAPIDGIPGWGHGGGGIPGISPPPPSVGNPPPSSVSPGTPPGIDIPGILP